MQTFLPYPDFTRSAQCLDNKRLGKQRVEAYQILRCLQTPNRWQHHPAVKMWKGYEDALKTYMNACISEWKHRGFTNTMRIALVPKTVKLPSWLGNAEFHASHRSNLLRKDASFYSKYKWSEPNNLVYKWPTH